MRTDMLSRRNEFRHFYNVGTQSFCLRVEEVRSSKTLGPLFDYWTAISDGMNETSEKLIEINSVHIVKNWREYMGVMLEDRLHQIEYLVEQVESGNPISCEDRVQAHLAENVFLAFVFGQRFGTNTIYNAGMIRDMLRSGHLRYGDVDYDVGHDEDMDVDDNANEDENDRADHDADSNSEEAEDDDGNDDDDDDAFDDYEDEDEEEQGEQQGVDLRDSVGEQGYRTWLGVPILRTYVPMIENCLTRLESEEDANASKEDRIVQRVLALLVTFARTYQVPGGQSTRTDYDFTTAFKESAVVNAAKRLTNDKQLLVDGRILPTDITAGLLRGNTLTCKLIASASGYLQAMRDGSQTLENKLKQAIVKYVHIFPMALLLKSGSRHVWQRVVDMSVELKLGNSSLLKQQPSRRDSGRYVRHLNLPNVQMKVIRLY